MLVSTCLGIVLCLAWPTLARAEPELSLVWNAVQGCPDAAWATQKIHDLLGRELLTDTAPGMRVHAELSTRRAGYVLRLRSVKRGARGDRTLKGATCEELAEAAALVIALAIDPEAVARQAEPAPAQAAEPETKPSSEAPKPDATPQVREQAPPKPSPSQKAPAPAPIARPWVARADLLGEWGFEPNLGLGVGGALAYQARIVRAELAGMYLFPRTGSDPGANGRVRVSMWALRPLACARLGSSVIGFALCAGGELGRAMGRGEGVAQSLRNSSPWLALWAGARLLVAVHQRLGLSLEPGVSIPFGRPRFVITDPQGNVKSTLYEPAVISARVTLGLELRF